MCHENQKLKKKIKDKKTKTNKNKKPKKKTDIIQKSKVLRIIQKSWHLIVQHKAANVKETKKTH